MDSGFEDGAAGWPGSLADAAHGSVATRGQLCTRYGGLHPARGLSGPLAEHHCTPRGGLHLLWGFRALIPTLLPPERVQTPTRGADFVPDQALPPPQGVQTPALGAETRGASRRSPHAVPAMGLNLVQRSDGRHGAHRTPDQHVVQEPAGQDGDHLGPCPPNTHAGCRNRLGRTAITSGHARQTPTPGAGTGWAGRRSPQAMPANTPRRTPHTLGRPTTAAPQHRAPAASVSPSAAGPRSAPPRGGGSRRGSGRTASTPLPAGSSSSQSSYRLPGKNGQASPQPMVMTTSLAMTASSVSTLGCRRSCRCPPRPSPRPRPGSPDRRGQSRRSGPRCAPADRCCR